MINRELRERKMGEVTRKEMYKRGETKTDMINEREREKNNERELK